MLKIMKRAAVIIALVAMLPYYHGVRAANYAFLDIDFENVSDGLWGFETSGSGFIAEAAVLDGSGAIRFGGGNGTGNPGVARLSIPYEGYGNSFEVEFDLYHPLSDAGDTFIRLTDNSDKDVFSLYLRESGDSSDIAGKTMRYGLNTVLGSNSLGDNAKGSAKLLSTPETGNAGENGITYHVHSFMDFDTCKQSLIITEKESGKEVVKVEDADIKNATEPAWLKIGYGYVVSEYEGVYIDNLSVSAETDKEILINSFDISEGKASAEIENVSGNDIDALLAYAVYKPDGSLESISYKDALISGETGSNVFMFEDTLQFEEGTEKEAKLFVWDRETMRPFTSSMSAVDTGRELNIANMVQNVPLKNKLLDDGYYTWCGSYIKGDDGRYHVFYSRWKLEYGFVPGWVSHSEIAHAVSDNIDGPYVFQEVVIGPRGREYWDGTTAHNPYIMEIEGKYYLYYMGTTAPEGTAETPKAYDADWYEYRNRQQIGVAVSDSLDGPWERFDEPIHKPDKTVDDTGATAWDSMVVNNPALTVMPDGRILMIYKGVQDTTGGDTSKPNGVVKIGAAIAESPMGPFEKQDGLLFEGSGTLAAEDPFIWYSSEDEKYYAVVRDAVGGFTGIKGALTLFESSDGVTDWHASKNPLVLPNYITWEDGTRNNSQVERPWLMFDEEGTPIMLFGATRINNSESFTTNIFIPLSDK